LPETYEFQPIGYVESDFEDPADPEEMLDSRAEVKLEEEYVDGLEGVEPGDALQVLFVTHLSKGYELVAPRRGGKVCGVFAARSPNRPNPVAVTTVRVLEMHGGDLVVNGIDAVDGTPVIDLKPYAALFDRPRNREDPRSEIRRNLRRGHLETLLYEAGALHGHVCPFLALGVKAGAHALDRIGAASSGMEDVVAVVETNSCFSDGIQFSTGCTFGNNALIYRDYGKTAVTVAERGGDAVRILVREDVMEDLDPEASELFEKVVKDREATAEEEERFGELWTDAAFDALQKPVHEVFEVEEVEPGVPEYAPIHEDARCDECGETVMAAKTVQREGRTLCRDCAGASFLQLDGTGVSRAEPKKRGED